MLLMMVAMIDIGLVILGNSTGSNAARDGARVGIVNYRNADIPGSSDHDAIVEAVEQRLVGNVKGPVTVVVNCLDGDTDTDKACASADPDTDVLEVKVTWTQIGITPFVTNSQHTETARLVIVGEVNLEEGAQPPITFTASNPTVVEGNAASDNRSLVFRVTRSFNTTDTSVGYTAVGAGPSPATAGVDFEVTSGTITFAKGGPMYVDVLVPINEDLVFEPDETVRLELSAPAPASVNHGTGTITNDDVNPPPVLLSVEIRDQLTPNGRIDYLVATFDKPIGGCGGTWTFSDASGVATQQSATPNGSTVQVRLNEPAGSTTFNTGPNVTVSGTGVCNTSGATAGAQSPPLIIDAAAPRVVAVSSTVTGSTLGLAQSGDTIRLTMSEVVSGVPVTASVDVVGGNGNPGFDSFSIPGITAAADLGRTDYMNGNRSARFSGLNNNVVVSGVNITVTLGPTCSNAAGNNACTNLTAAAGTAQVSVTPAATLVDGPNAAVGPFTTTIRLF